MQNIRTSDQITGILVSSRFAPMIWITQIQMRKQLQCFSLSFVIGSWRTVHCFAILKLRLLEIGAPYEDISGFVWLIMVGNANQEDGTWGNYRQECSVFFNVCIVLVVLYSCRMWVYWDRNFCHSCQARFLGQIGHLGFYYNCVSFSMKFSRIFFFFLKFCHYFAC